MAVIGYVYDRHNNLIGQLFDVVGFQCSMKLNDVSTGELTISNENLLDALLILKENNRIKVMEGNNGTERLLISWYMRGIEATLKNTVIKIEDMISFLDDKVLFNPLNYTWPINALLQQILSQINAREQTELTCVSDVSTSVTKKYEKGETFANVLKDLRENAYEYVVRDTVLYFNHTIGIDRSVPSNDYYEFVWDINSPLDRTIRDAKLVMDIKQMCNSCIGKDGNVYGYAEDLASIQEFWRIERSMTNSGNIQQATQNYVNERKDSIKEFDISPNIPDFFACDVGDVVRVYINSGNDLMFYDGSMKVIEKSYTAGEMTKVTYKLWKSKVKTIDLAEKLREINRRVGKLELQ